MLFYLMNSYLGYYMLSKNQNYSVVAKNQLDFILFRPPILEILKYTAFDMRYILDESSYIDLTLW